MFFANLAGFDASLCNTTSLLCMCEGEFHPDKELARRDTLRRYKRVENEGFVADY